MNNETIKKKYLSKITKKTFKDAIYLCYKDGITSVAPLGFSGDTVTLHGSNKNGRKSIVSIRNYCGDAELLITDKKGSFIFYGRFDINLGIEFVLNYYWEIFIKVKNQINTTIVKRSEFKDMEIPENCHRTEGFKMLSAYQNRYIL